MTVVSLTTLTQNLVGLRTGNIGHGTILDRDIVFLTLREARPNDIVAALIDGESTLIRKAIILYVSASIG